MNETTYRRALFGLALTGLVAGVVGHFSGDTGVASRIWAAAAVPVVVALAISILRDLRMGRVGVDAIALVSMSAALALGESLAAVVIAIMYSGGNVLEDFARGRAQRDLKALTDRSPRFAHRKRSERIEDIPVDQVAVGDELLVRAGELLPVDGTLLDASASLDESAVTGEPLPELRRHGDLLRSGTVNAGEAFRFRASALASQSTYAGIVRMVEAAQTAKAPFMRMADRFALFLLPATLIVALGAWYLAGDPIRGLAVLVVATPCPLILAAPVAFIGGVSRAARAGVLMKGSTALEALAQVRTAIFDKTGTLTHGGADLIEIAAAPGRRGDEIFGLLASLEQASHHVIADFVLKIARERALVLLHPQDVREFRGAGLEGKVDGARILAGSRTLVLGTRPLPEWAERSAIRYWNQPVLMVYLAVDGQTCRHFDLRRWSARGCGKGFGRPSRCGHCKGRHAHR